MLGTNVSKRRSRRRRQLTVTGGETVDYGTLIWAAGGDARRLSCPGRARSPASTSVRDKADTDRLRAELAAGAKRAVVIGGGYIGLEAAAVLRKLGCEVMLVEMLDRVLARVAGEDLSRFYEAEHRAHGVRSAPRAPRSRRSRARIASPACGSASGEMIACDVVVVGIGIVACGRPADRGRRGGRQRRRRRPVLPHQPARRLRDRRLRRARQRLMPTAR